MRLPERQRLVQHADNRALERAGSDSGILSCTTQQIPAFETAFGSLSGQCRNWRGAVRPVRGLLYKYDATDPALNPSVTPNPVTLGGSATATAGATDNLSRVDTQSCDPVDTSTVGSFTVSCTATDKAGNTNTANAGYDVVPAACITPTITGTAGDDILEGTSGNDVIYDVPATTRSTAAAATEHGTAPAPVTTRSTPAKAKTWSTPVKGRTSSSGVGATTP